MDQQTLLALAPHESIDPYRELFERSPQPMWVYDCETLEFLAVNDAAVDDYGYSREEFRAMTIKDIRPTEDVPLLIEDISRRAVGFQQAGIWRHRRKDGRILFAEVMSNDLWFDNRRARLVLVNDVTQRERAHQLEAAVYKIAEAAGESPTLNDLFHAIHAIIGGVMPASNLYIALYDSEHNLISFPYFADEVDEAFPPHPPGKGLTEYVLRNGKSLLCDLALDDELCRRGEIEHIGARSPIWLGVPLCVDQKAIGVLAVQHYRDPHAFGEREQHMLEFVSSQVARAIERKQAEDALRASEERYRRLVDMSPDAIAVHRDGKFLFLNSAGVRLFGASSSADLIGRPVMDFVDPSYRPLVAERIKTIRENGTEAPLKEERFLRLDGTAVDVEVAAIPFGENGSSSVQVVIRDVTDRKRAEREIETRANELSALYETTRDLSTQQDIPTLLHTIVERATLLMRVSGGFIDLYDPIRGDLEQAVAVGLPSAPGTRTEKGEGLAGRVAQSLQPQVNNNYSSWDHRSKRYDSTGINAAAAVPMLYGGELIGVLGVHESEPASRQFSDADTRLLSLFAGQAASAVHNARLFTETRLRAEQLAMLYDAGLALNAVLEPRSQLEFLFKIAVKTLHASRAEFFAFDQPNNRLRFELGIGAGGRIAPEPGIVEFPLGQEHGLVGWVAKSRLPLYIPDVTTDPRWINSDLTIRSALWVPVERENVLLGVLSVLSSNSNAFTPQDERLLMLFANQASVAMENARLFSETEQRLQQLHALSEIDNAINSSLDLRVTLDVVLGEVISQLHVDAASLLTLSPHTQTLSYAASRGFHSRALQHTELRLGEGLAGRAAFERSVVRCADLSREPGSLRRSPALAEEGFVAYFAFPLLAKGQVKGVLEVFHRSSLDPDAEWLEFARALAGQAAIAMDNSELLQSLQRSNAELTLAYDATIEGWSRALELRDHDTEGHTARVAAVTCRLAREIGIGDVEWIHIRRGALLHDIGKIGIPDSILFKPGPLDPEEWEIMRRHPVYAYDMLSPIQYLRPALDIPYCHHEKWDGSGYPRGLKGEHIPLAARVFAVVDIWDALLSDRPYRQAWSSDRVTKYLLEQAGKHLDPKAVEAFLAMDKQTH